ncbi:MAG: hypothetical protein HC836_14085 [Richelia sp. RM2_1_2]|nr:hypothetical protein [Richelia sp. RM2_1_2]
MLCQNEKFDPNGYQLPYIKYYEQPYYPLDKNQDKLPDLPFLVFLDVWERHITYIQDEVIREVAFEGAETATRSQVIWQVKVKELEDDVNSCDDIKWDDLLEQWQPKHRGLLAAKAKETTQQTEACIIKPDARYRGRENQLYRVEIHVGGTAEEATFKWSRENGSVAFPIDADNGIGISDKVITVKLKHWWRDCHFGLTEGDWVELVDDYISLHQLVNPLWKVDKIEPEDFLVTLTREESSTLNIGNYPLLRRWEQEERSGLSLSNGAVPILLAQNDWFTLEDGVQIKFQPGSKYRTGDYWLIPARTATGDVEWDEDDNGTPLALPPHGVEHYYAPLAVIANLDSPEDCRHQFYPITHFATTKAIGEDVIWQNSEVQ